MKDEWRTKPALFKTLNEAFGPFDRDVCASGLNKLCHRYLDKNSSCLTSDPWGYKERVFMNPPYGRQLHKFVEAAYNQSVLPSGPELIVALLPASTDTEWFFRCVLSPGAGIIFLKGRRNYLTPEGAEPKGRCPFGSMVIIWHNYHHIDTIQWNIIKQHSGISILEAKP
jgi:site-specific DNA-methyltransferase (adenine-specific)